MAKSGDNPTKSGGIVNYFGGGASDNDASAPKPCINPKSLSDDDFALCV